MTFFLFCNVDVARQGSDGCAWTHSWVVWSGSTRQHCCSQPRALNVSVVTYAVTSFDNRMFLSGMEDLVFTLSRCLKTNNGL